MTVDVQDLLVRKSIVIHAPAEDVFDVFVAHHDAWWPREHHIGKTERFTAKVEPFAGGRWYERGDDGTECNWGRVLVFEPPTRIVLRWDINAQWQYDPEIGNEVEVRFVVEAPERTRVELEHRKIERYADQAAMMHAIFDSPEGWTATVQALAREAERRYARR